MLIQGIPHLPLKLSSQRHSVVHSRIARKQELKELADLDFSMPDMADSQLSRRLSLLPSKLVDLM